MNTVLDIAFGLAVSFTILSFVSLILALAVSSDELIQWAIGFVAITVAIIVICFPIAVITKNRKAQDMGCITVHDDTMVQYKGVEYRVWDEGTVKLCPIQPE